MLSSNQNSDVWQAIKDGFDEFYKNLVAAWQEFSKAGDVRCN